MLVGSLTICLNKFDESFCRQILDRGKEMICLLKSLYRRCTCSTSTLSRIVPITSSVLVIQTAPSQTLETIERQAHYRPGRKKGTLQYFSFTLVIFLHSRVGDLISEFLGSDYSTVSCMYMYNILGSLRIAKIDQRRTTGRLLILSLS